MIVPRLSVQVRSIEQIADGVKRFCFTSLDDSDLPKFSAGAHIDVTLGNGLIRSYSLIGDPDDRQNYQIAVALDANTRGGSRYMHERVSQGDSLLITVPKNNFQLAENDSSSVLFAGGIGITPIYAMVRQLVKDERPWHLYYAARSRSIAAFVDELSAFAASSSGTLTLWFDDENQGKYFAIDSAMSEVPRDAHVYCCGPGPMLRAFLKLAHTSFAEEQVHYEYFRSPDGQVATQAPLSACRVTLARSGTTVDVPEGSSILDALIMQGIDAPYSCYEGVCGTCETRVIEGVPDHRDELLSEAAKASNQTMLICCSGSKTANIVLDI